MQREPIHFGAVSASRAKRSAAGIAMGHATRKSSYDPSSATVLDEAFADYRRVDAAALTNDASAVSGPTNWRATTRELIADISMQLTTLDSQRRQLARLLESVETDATV